MSDYDFDAAVAASLAPASPSPQSARAGFVTALDTNPDAQAEARRVARSTGVPVDTALAMPDVVKKQARIGEIDFGALAKTSPATAELLADMDRAKVAHDDVETLGLIERTVRQFGGGGAEAVGMSLSGAGHLLDVGQRGLARLAGALLPTPESGGGATVESLAGPLIGEGWRGTGGVVKGGARGLMVPAGQRTFYDDVVAGLGQVAGQIAMLPVTRGAGLYTQGADIVADKIATDTASQGYKDLAILGGAAVTGITEKYALDKILGPMAVPIKNRLAAGLARIGVAASAEGGQEMVENLGHDALRKMLTNPEAGFDLGGTLYEGGVGATVGALARSVVESALHVRARGAQRQQQAGEAEQTSELLQRLEQLSAASKLRGREVETFEQFVAQAAEDGPVENLYINADVLMQSGIAEQLAQASPAVAEQLQAAMATGGQVRIPMSEYAARIAGTELSAPLLDHLKTDPAGFSRAEAEQYMNTEGEQLRAEVEQQLAKVEGEDAFRTSADAVRANVKAQLDTAGRFTPEVNDAYAGLVSAWYATTASRMGLTPEQLFEMRPMGGQAEAVAGGEQLEQSSLQNGSVALDALAREGDNKAIIAKALIDSAGPDAEQFANVLVGESFGAKTDGLGGIPSLAAVLPHMRRAILDNPQILDAVVRSVPVDVVNNLFGSEGAAKVALHNEAMLKNSTAFDADVSVSGALADAPDPVGLLVREAARAAAEVSRVAFRAGREAGEGRSAARAGEGAFSQGPSPRATYSPSQNLITLLRGADLTSFLHESGHAFLEMQTQIAAEIARDAEMHGPESLSEGERQILADTEKLLAWFGVPDLQTWQIMSFEERRAHHEKFARGFEAYLFEGKAPAIELQSMFQRFRSWLLNIYRQLSALNVELTDEVRGAMDRMLATDEAIKLAEQSRSMMPLFESAEAAGMTPEEFAQYQALGQGATEAAQADLAARGVRDMQWLHNARSRELKRLQKEAAARRAEMQMEARREVMSQPVYRAWQFLTGKLTQDDKVTPKSRPKSDPNIVDETVDSLFVAMAKLGGIQRDQVETEWGLDKAEKVAPPVFGKHVLRRTDGLTLDEMRGALTQYGYLSDESAEGWNPREFEEAFMAELGGSPVYSANADYALLQDARPGEGLNFDGVQSGRLDKAALNAIGVPAEIVEHLVNLKMTAKDGWHPDILADKFGFASGDEMVRTIAAAQSPKEAIAALTDARMLERYGELATPAALERAADRAIHNEARIRFALTEEAALARATGKQRLLADAARAFAQQTIGRLKLRDIRPAQYVAAAQRAAKAAQAAKSAGDLATAAAEKRNHVLNLYLAKAAHEARDVSEATIRGWRELANRPDKRLGKTYDLDIVNAVRAILGGYGIAEKRAKKAGEYLEAVKRYDAEMFAVLQASVEAADAHAKPVKDLTVEELRGLADEIGAMLHLARRSRQMEVDGNLIDRQEIEADLMNRLAEIGIPDAIPGEGQAVTPAESRMAKFKSLIAFARRVESWVGSMDGAQQMGPFRRFVWSRIKDAADAYRADKAKYLREFRALFDAIAPTMKAQIIAAPELGYTFGRDSGGSATNEILHALLHTGNASNKRKLLLGREWASELPDGSLNTVKWDAFVSRMVAEGKLTKAHFDFVQGVWDLLESIKPLAQQTHRDVFGRYFDEITAEGFADPFGVMRRGGYVPAMADTRVVKDAELRQLSEDDNAALSYAFPTTPKGFTKARVEYNRPLMLDLRTLAQHIDKVLLFAHMEMPVRDVQRILSKDVGAALARVDPAAIPGMLAPWLKRSATQQVATPIAGDAGTMRFFSVLRARAGAAAMFGNLANAAQQITGFSIAAVKVKPSLLLSAMGDYMKGPRAMVRAVAEASPYMAGRIHNEVAAMTDAIDSILLNPSVIESAQRWTMHHAYFLQSAVDNVMSPIIWTGAYNQALASGMEHRDAVRLADSAVRETQGSSLPEDISRIESGNAFVRLFTQFAGYFNMQANLLGTEFVKLARDYGLRNGAGRGLYVLALGFLAPAVVGEAIIQAFRGGPDDEDKDGEYLDDWLAALFGWAPLRTLAAMVPVAGPVVIGGVNAWNGKPYDDRIANSPAISMLESSLRAPVSVAKATLGDGSSQKAVRDVATLISVTVGVPATLAARPIGYVAGAADGRITPTSGADAMRGVITGMASPQSRE